MDYVPAKEPSSGGLVHNQTSNPQPILAKDTLKVLLQKEVTTENGGVRSLDLPSWTKLPRKGIQSRLNCHKLEPEPAFFILSGLPIHCAFPPTKKLKSVPLGLGA